MCLGLALVVLIAYWGVWHSEFLNYDDDIYVSMNPHVATGFSAENLKWTFNAGYAGNWHPLTWVSHMLDCRLFGLNPAGHHAMNLALHMAGTVLLFLVLRRLTGSVWRSAFVAALFGIHPLHVESVAWVAERKDVLSALFWMLTIAAYVRYTERTDIRRYVPVAVLFTLGLMAKPTVVTLPFVLLLLDFWPLRRLPVAGKGQQGGLRKLVLEKTPLLALSIGSSIVTYTAQHRTDAVSALGAMSLGLRIENALVSYVKYIGKMLYPVDLAVLYPHPMHGLPVWQVAGAGVLLAGITVMAVALRRSRPYVLVGWLWYAITLVPMIGLVQVGIQAMADRYTYIPLVGLFIIVAWGALGNVEVEGYVRKGQKGEGGDSDFSPINHLATAVISVAVIIALAARTHGQTLYWRSAITLFTHALRVADENAVAHDNLAGALAKENRIDEALEHNRRAIALDPTLASAHSAYGSVLIDKGMFDEAVRELRQATKINPNDPLAHNSLGIALASTGQIDEAIREFREAIRIDSYCSYAYANLGRALAARGQFDEAVEAYQSGIKTSTDSRMIRTALDSVQRKKQQLDNALRVSRNRVRRDPGSAEAHTDLARALAQRGRQDQAIEELRTAIRLKPDFAQAHKGLALVWYTRGDYAESWREVHLCRKYGLQMPPNFISDLSRRMPEPRH